jgi:hypothetical protein
MIEKAWLRDVEQQAFKVNQYKKIMDVSNKKKQ